MPRRARIPKSANAQAASGRMPRTSPKKSQGAAVRGLSGMGGAGDDRAADDTNNRSDEDHGEQAVADEARPLDEQAYDGSDDHSDEADLRERDQNIGYGGVDDTRAAILKEAAHKDARD